MEKILPKGWIETNIESATEILDNARKPINADERGARTGNIPYYGATGIAGWIDDYIFNEELVLVGEDGAPFFDKTKNVSYMISGKSWVNNHAHVLKAKKELTTNKFLLHFFNQFDYKDFVGGTTRLKLTQGDLKKIPIPLPPLPTQQRIVAKLDRLFARIDQMKTNWSNFLDKVDAFVESSLIDKRTGEYFLRKELKEYLEEGTERIGKDWPGKLKIGISAQKGIIDLDVGQKQTFENYKIVRPGDFVYNAMRVNIGSIGIYEGSEIAITSPDYIVFRITNLLSPKLLLRFLKSKGGLLEIGANTQGSVRSRLYFKYLINVNYPIAPLKKQIEAEKFLSIFDTAINEWNRNISIQLDNLKQSILSKAFSGELVEQLLEDGDARELLEALRQAQRPGKGEMKRSGTGKKENVKPKSEKILRRAQDDTVLKQVAEPEEKYLGKE